MSNNQDGTDIGGKEAKGSLKFDYIKSSLFRSAHIDGVVGGVTPQLGIYMAVFNERQPLPQQVTHEVEENGLIGEEIRSERKTRDALVREMEFGLVMNLETAEAISSWLQDSIKKVKQIQEIQNEKGMT